MTPRLVNLRLGAQYIGVSFWTLRDWVLAGLIPTVQLPPLRPRPGDRAKLTLRRTLVDIRDLDAFIDQNKLQAPQTSMKLRYNANGGRQTARENQNARDIETSARAKRSMKTDSKREPVPAVCPDSEAADNG